MKDQEDIYVQENGERYGITGPHDRKRAHLNSKCVQMLNASKAGRPVQKHRKSRLPDLARQSAVGRFTQISRRKPIHKISITKIISSDLGHRETDLILCGLEKFLNDNRKPASQWDGLHTAPV